MISLMWNLRNETNKHRIKEIKRGNPRETLNYREQTDGYLRGGR